MKRGQLPRQVHDRTATETHCNENGTKTHCHFVGGAELKRGRTAKSENAPVYTACRFSSLEIGSSDEADKFYSSGGNVRDHVGAESANAEGSRKRIFRRARAVFGHPPKSRAFGARNENGRETG